MRKVPYFRMCYEKLNNCKKCVGYTGKYKSVVPKLRKNVLLDYHHLFELNNN